MRVLFDSAFGAYMAIGTNCLSVLIGLYIGVWLRRKTIKKQNILLAYYESLVDRQRKYIKTLERSRELDGECPEAPSQSIN